MKKINLTESTFIIPLRIDFKERLDNARITLNYLLKYFDTNIILLENGTKSHIDEFKLEDPSKITYLFEKSEKNEPFLRMTYLNTMLKLVTTPVVINYDVDIILPVEIYKKSQDFILSNKYDILNPFSNPPGAYYVGDNDKRKLEQTLDLSCLDLNRIHNSFAGCGFCVFINTSIYKKLGGENTNFKSYGPEDVERFYRFSKFNYKTNLTSKPTGSYSYISEDFNSPVFHLEHPRGNDSSPNNPFFVHNTNLFNTIKSMSLETYENYINDMKRTNIMFN